MTVYKKFTKTGTPGADVGAHQCVATDGTNIYCTSGGGQAPENNLQLYKYDPSYALIKSVNCATHGPGTAAQVNGIYWHPTYNRLFITANNYSATPAASWVFEYDTDLTFLRYYAVPVAGWIEHIVPHGGYWWAVYDDRHEVDQFTYSGATNTFTFVATHTLPDSRPNDGPSNHLWNAALWLDDLLYVNMHEGAGSWAPFLNAYRWTGTAFEVAAIGLRPPTDNCTQGVTLAPDGVTLLWAERIVGSPSVGNVVTSTFAEGGTLVLDYFPAAHAGYALRKLRTDYTGPAVRVRRDSDNAELDIGFAESGFLDEPALLAFAGAANAHVTKLYDQSAGSTGNVGELAQATAARQPKIASAGAVFKSGGKPAMLFESANQHFLANAISDAYPQPNTIFVQVNSRGANAHRQYVFDGSNSADREVLALDGTTGQNGIWANLWVDGPNYQTGSHQHTCLFNQSGSLHRVDGVQEAAGTAGGQPLRLGSLGTNFDASQEFLDGYVNELIWIPASLDTPSTTFIEADQAAVAPTPPDPPNPGMPRSMKLTRRTVVQAVTESAYGTDPGSGYIGLLARTGTQIQIQGDQVVRDTLRDTLSPLGHVIGLKGLTITLPLELRGAGATGSTLNLPELDALLKACSMAREDGAVIAITGASGSFVRGETLNNTTASNTVGTIADIDGATLYIRALANMPSSADALAGGTSSATGTVSGTPDAGYVYRPDSPDPDSAGSATVQYFADGIRHVATGARGTFTMNFEVGQIPQISFTLSALYAAPTDTANASPSYLSLVPSPVLGAGLIIGALDTSLVAVNAVTFDIGNTVSSRDDLQAAAGRKGYIISARAPTGSIDPEATTLANFNPYSDWEESNSVAMAVGIGSATGSRVRVIMPATQYTELPYGDRNGIVTYQFGFRATGDDDEMLLFFS